MSCEHNKQKFNELDLGFYGQEGAGVIDTAVKELALPFAQRFIVSHIANAAARLAGTLWATKDLDNATRRKVLNAFVRDAVKKERLDASAQAALVGTIQTAVTKGVQHSLNKGTSAAVARLKKTAPAQPIDMEDISGFELEGNGPVSRMSLGEQWHSYRKLMNV